VKIQIFKYEKFVYFDRNVLFAKNHCLHEYNTTKINYHNIVYLKVLAIKESFIKEMCRK